MWRYDRMVIRRQHFLGQTKKTIHQTSIKESNNERKRRVTMWTEHKWSCTFYTRIGTTSPVNGSWTSLVQKANIYLPYILFLFRVILQTYSTASETCPFCATIGRQFHNLQIDRCRHFMATADDWRKTVSETASGNFTAYITLLQYASYSISINHNRNRDY